MYIKASQDMEGGHIVLPVLQSPKKPSTNRVNTYEFISLILTLFFFPVSDSDVDIDFRSKQWLDKVETTPPHAPVLPHQKILKSSNSHKQ